MTVQEGDSDSLDSGFGELTGQTLQVFGVEVAFDCAVGEGALTCFTPQPPRHQRYGEVQRQVVEFVPVLTPHLEDVAKALGGDQGRAWAASLDQGIRHECGAVNDAVDIGRVQGVVVQCTTKHVFDPGGGLVVRRQCLADGDDAVVTEDAQVGERSADVDADGQPG